MQDDRRGLRRIPWLYEHQPWRPDPPATAKHYVERLLAKLGRDNRTAAARTAMEVLGRWDVGCGMWDVGCGMWVVEGENKKRGSSS